MFEYLLIFWTTRRVVDPFRLKCFAVDRSIKVKMFHKDRRQSRPSVDNNIRGTINDPGRLRTWFPVSCAFPMSGKSQHPRGFGTEPTFQSRQTLWRKQYIRHHPESMLFSKKIKCLKSRRKMSERSCLKTVKCRTKHIW